MAEWSKATVLKTVVPQRHQGFESLLLLYFVKNPGRVLQISRAESSRAKPDRIHAPNQDLRSAAISSSTKHLWRGGREAEGGGLLNRYTGLNLYREFESPPLRYFDGNPGRVRFALGTRHPPCHPLAALGLAKPCALASAMATARKACLRQCDGVRIPRRGITWVRGILHY